MFASLTKFVLPVMETKIHSRANAHFCTKQQSIYAGTDCKLLLLEAVGSFTSLLVLDNLPLADIVLCSQYRAGQASLLYV